MSSTTTSWILQLVDKITSPLGNVQKEADGAAAAIDRASKNTATFGDCLRKLKPIDWMAVRQGIDTIDSGIKKFVEVGAKYDASLREVSAITGITGKELDKLGSQARSLAKDFGSSASDNLGTFQTILSRLGPQIGESAEALGGMGKYVNTLSKTMGGDVAGATDALTTSMLQFRVNLDDPIEAAGEMERMMNVMAAGAKYGAAEVTQVGQSLVQTGVQAKLANLSFEEVNAAIQAMAQGGKYGSEAGVAIRNVLTSMSAETKLTKESAEVLEQYGIKFSDLSDTSVSFADRLRKLAPLQNDINALTSIFKSENAAAAQILISYADDQEDLTRKITGTNTAYEQAQVIMGGWTEKMKRAKEWIDNLKIGTFSFTSVASIATGAIGGMLAGLADISQVYSGLGPVIKSAVTWAKSWSVTAGISKVATAAWAGVQWALNAAFVASPIGWIVLGIGALTAGIVLAWNKCEGFRAAVVGIGAAIKMFGDIIKDYVIDRIKGFLSGIGALGQALVKLFKGDFNGAWQSATQGARDLIGVDAAKNAYNKAKGLGEAYEKGAAAGRASFQKKTKEEKESAGTKDPAVNKILKPGAIRPNISIKDKETGKKGNNDGKSMNLSGSGSGGGKSVTMNVTLNITNHGVRNSDEFTEQVVRKINDRLNDSLAAVG